jgi:hypothetical protein
MSTEVSCVAATRRIGISSYKPRITELCVGYLAAGPRFLEAGVPVHLVEVPPRPEGFWEVNNPEDIAQVERALKLRG